LLKIVEANKVLSRHGSKIHTSGTSGGKHRGVGLAAVVRRRDKKIRAIYDARIRPPGHHY